MTDTTGREFLVDREDIRKTSVASLAVPSADELGADQVLLHVDRFSLTSNNITYAAMGTDFAYWNHFPTSTAWGKVPVWGFGDVVASRHPQIETGERVYGYFPMSTHLVVEAEGVTAGGFLDRAFHRVALPVFYRQYTRVAEDPFYHAKTEELQMLLRPLFATAFLLDDFFTASSFFGAGTVVLTSASSKTAAALAYVLSSNRAERSGEYRVVGLTSPRNREFVEGLGCYDTVLTYDRITELPAEPTVTVDFAGNGDVLAGLHNHLGAELKYSCLVGLSHWEKRGGGEATLPGPQPILFFAPDHAEKRAGELGPELFTALAAKWNQFVDFAGGWIQIDEGSGEAAVGAVYQKLLSGDFAADRGYILSLG